MVTDDAALMLQLQGGDARAYRELCNRHLKRVLNVAFRILGDAGEAEDVTQQVFLKLWADSGSWTPAYPLVTWLFKVTRNLCIDRLRKRRPVALEVDDAAAESSRPSTLLLRKEVSQSVQSALSALPERQRTALSLSHFDGMSNSEIAGVMQVGVEAVESLLARARRALRLKFAPSPESN